MNKATESTPKKANGKPPAAPATSKEPEKPKAPKIVQTDNVWALCREWMSQGKKDEEIKKAAESWLTKNTDSKTALQFFAKRISYRALRRAKISLAAQKKTVKAGKGK